MAKLDREPMAAASASARSGRGAIRIRTSGGRAPAGRDDSGLLRGYRAPAQQPPPAGAEVAHASVVVVAGRSWLRWYTSHSRPSGSVTQNLSWLAWQQS